MPFRYFFARSIKGCYYSYASTDWKLKVVIVWVACPISFWYDLALFMIKLRAEPTGSADSIGFYADLMKAGPCLLS
jgi:hypothetical protein